MGDADDKIIELARLAETEPNIELDAVVLRHSRPWESQKGTFWDRFKLLFITASSGLALTVVLVVSPLVFNSSGTGTMGDQASGASSGASVDANSGENSTANAGNLNNAGGNTDSVVNPSGDGGQAGVRPNSSLVITKIDSSLGIIDRVLAEPVDEFEITELD